MSPVGLTSFKNSLLALKSTHLMGFAYSSLQQNLSKLTCTGVETPLLQPQTIPWYSHTSVPVFLVLPTHHF